MQEKIYNPAKFICFNLIYEIFSLYFDDFFIKNAAGEKPARITRRRIAADVPQQAHACTYFAYLSIELSSF